MATNENVNKVIYGNQTVMDITDTTAEESDVASGEVFYKASGKRSVGTLNKDSAVWGNIRGTLSDQTDLQIELNRAYTKTAAETSSIDDLDLIPVQKISASSDGRRNVKFRNLKSILKGFFDDIYQAILTFDNTPTVNSDNPVKSSGIYNALMPKVSESLLKSTVGWTGKNKLHIPDSVVSLGVFTVNRNTDGEVVSIGVSGTPSADQDLNIGSATNPLPISILSNGDILSKGNTLPSTDLQQQIWYYDNSKTYISYQNEQSEGCSVNKIVVSIPSGAAYFVINNKAKANKVLNTTLYPMLRKASITDDTYEPYHESVEEEIEQIYADNGVLGAKNLLPNNAIGQTTHGITYTVNADGSITSNGTSDGWANLILCNNLPLKKGKYILSGIPNVNGAYLTIAKQSGDISCTFSNSVRYFELASDEVITQARVSYRSGTTVSDEIFYPMLRLASDPDDTYVPYAMTNRELTEELTVKESAVTDIVEGASVTNNHNNLYKQGKFVHMCIELAHVTATAYDTIIAKVPSNYKPRAFAVDCNMSNIQIARIYVDNSGNVKSRNALSDVSFVASTTWITD